MSRLEFGSLDYVAIRGRPVIGVPTDRSGAVVASRRIHGFSPKRRLLRSGLVCISFLGGAPLVSSRRLLGDLPNLGGSEHLIADIAASFQSTHLSVTWPSEIERGRAYLHFMDSTGRPIGFLKLAPPSQAPNLERESSALQQVARSGANGTTGAQATGYGRTPTLPWRTPKLLGAETTGTVTSWILLEAVPNTPGRLTGRTDLDRLAESIANGSVRHVDPDQLDQLSWWSKALNLTELSPSFVASLREAAHGGIDVSRVHGDFGAHNVMRDGSGIVIFDWESSSPDGPAGSDYWFSRLINEPIAQLIGDAQRAGPRSSHDLILALGYAAALKTGPAAKIISDWPYEILKGNMK